MSGQSNDLSVFHRKRDWTKFWILVTVVVTGGLLVLFYFFRDTVYLTISQIAILAITAIALFMYARDTNRQLQIAEEVHYQPAARFSVLQVLMTLDDLRCPLQIEVLRNIPFIAKVDLQLEVGGKLIPTGSPLYDGENEWAIYASFEHLPGNIRESVLKNIPSGMSLEQYLSKGVPNVPSNLQNIATRVTVTPLMIYKNAGSREIKLTSAARSYLDLCYDKDGNIIQTKDGKVIFKWMPDVERDRYRDMKWTKIRSLSDFPLESEIETS